MTDEERLITRIHEGKTAQAILAWLNPVLNELENDIHIKLKSLYRQGMTESGALASVAAELCVLEDLRGRIESKIRAGNTAANTINNGVKND